jgi:hypothetical protein
MSGLTSNFGDPGAPGFISPFAQGAVQSAQGLGMQSMVNRYNQLGLGSSTPELMDIGALPSVTGGIPAEAQATLGQIQNNQLTTAGSQGAGANKSPASMIGSLGSLAKFA